MAVIQSVDLNTVVRWNKPPYSFGTNFTFTKNSTTSVDLEIPVKFALTSIEYYFNNSLLADSFNGYLIDIDDVLGLGSNTVLGQFANGKHVADGIVIEKRRDVISVIGIAGLYMRFTYTSTAGVLGSDVTGYLNLDGFNLTSLDI